MEGFERADTPRQDLDQLVDDDGRGVLLDNDETYDQQAEDLDEELHLENYIGDSQTKYELRPSARDVKANYSRTWIDDDKTGLYDPDAEARKLRQKPKRPNRRLLKVGFCPWNLDESDEEGEVRKDRAPKERLKLEITLPFKSEAARAAFRKHVKALPAEPEPTEELFNERRLRRRNSGVDFSHSSSAKPSKKNRLFDDLPDDLTGHPVARGCWECPSIGVRCPLLDDERAWPCTTCLDDDHECELITPPTYKRPCEHCKGKRHGCSYTYNLDHDGPCDECACVDWHCVAGPAKEATRERISYDRDWENDPWHEAKAPKTRKLPSCRRCSERKQPCSFSAGDKSEVCTACDMAGEDCHPELETKPSRKRKRAQPKVKCAKEEDGGKTSWGADIFGETAAKPKSKLIVIGGSSDTSDPDLPAHCAQKRVKTKPKPIMISEDEDTVSDEESDTPPPPKKSKDSGKTKQQGKQESEFEMISTKFAHPIKFNHEGKQPCHFCSDIRFAMFGLGTTEVEVIVWHDDRGLEEVSGDHRKAGIEETRMCVSCTTSRMLIVMCGKHELVQMEGAAADNRAVIRLLNNKTTGKERWCSICPALAQYQCCTPGLQGQGCGLVLCEACMVSVVASDGHLDMALKHLPDAPTERRMLELRADHEFLKQDGLLIKYMLWQM